MLMLKTILIILFVISLVVLGIFVDRKYRKMVDSAVAGAEKLAKKVVDKWKGWKWRL